MSRFSIVPLFVVIAACDSDYGINENKDPPGGPIDTSPDPIDTFVPHTEDTYESPPDETRPVAVCEASPEEVDAGDTITFMGGQSYDPLGESITEYNWTLVATPNGSDSRLSSGSGANRTVLSDLAGDYTARLVVRTRDGRVSLPCEATSTAIPGQNLWVEMFWAHNDDDMDLHLLKPGGSPRTSGDCYYANCRSGLNWGGSGTSDNPVLDLDDIPGVGPENINIDQPASGTYTVFVDDYSGSTGDYSGANNVTVNIYVGGVLEWTDTRPMSGEAPDEYFAEVDWPSGTVRAR